MQPTNRAYLTVFQLAVLPEVSDKAVLLWQVQEVNEEVHPVLCFFGGEAVDAAEEPQCVADSEFIIQSDVLQDIR